MKTNIVFATGNEHKMQEIREILAGLPVEVLSLKEAEISADVNENGTTFEENAVIKAKAAAEQTDAIVLADDSGLEIDYLNREPGIYSARYMGEDTSYEVKNKELLRRLEGVPKEKRTARFVCAVAAVFPDGETLVRRGGRDTSEKNRRERTDLDTIRYFTWRNTGVRRRNFPGRKKMR